MCPWCHNLPFYLTRGESIEILLYEKLNQVTYQYCAWSSEQAYIAIEKIIRTPKKSACFISEQSEYKTILTVKHIRESPSASHIWGQTRNSSRMRTILAFTACISPVTFSVFMQRFLTRTSLQSLKRPHRSQRCIQYMFYKPELRVIHSHC